MGYGFRDMGRWLDRLLEVKDFDDLANININAALEKIIGKIPADVLNTLQAEAVKAGFLAGPKDVTANLLVPLVRMAAEPDFKMEDITPKEEGKKPSRADEIREQKHKAWEEDRAEKKRRQEEADKRREDKDRERRRDKGRAKAERRRKEEASEARREKAGSDRADKQARKEVLRKEELLAKEMAKDPAIRKAEGELKELAKKENAGEKVKPKEVAKARKKLDDAKEAARKKGEYRREGKMQKAFGKAGERGAAAVKAFKHKGILGGLLVSFTASLGFVKDIAKKIVFGAPKLILKHPILAALAGAATYGYFYFSDDEEPKPAESTKIGEGANKTVFTEETEKELSEASEERDLATKAPKTFEDKVALQVDLAISAVME